jgi:hypothetical protein
MIKPILDIDEFRRTIREHMRRRQEAKKYSEEKVVEFIEARAEEHETKAPTKRSKR